MAWRHMYPQEVTTDDLTVAGMAAALRSADPGAAIISLKFFVPDELLPVFYAGADGVLANSGYEPFGLVGLEAMGAGGIAYVGPTGEDYAIPLQNCVVLDDVPDPDEIVHFALSLRDEPELATRIRRNARATARLYTWDAVIPLFLTKLWFLADRQGTHGR
jgi:glycosyltransferase involved in cell wall biosynthesis